MLLYRPTGLKELELLYQSNMTAWPPRLPDQPIFYPVLNQDYAAQIARDWNTKYDDFVGYVTQFEVDDEYVAQFKVEQVGGKEHLELWVPAEELETFNQHLTSKIVVKEAFFGTQFDATQAHQILNALHNEISYRDFQEAVHKSHQFTFLYFAYWKAKNANIISGSMTDKRSLLDSIQAVWKDYQPDITLCDRGNLVNL